MYYKVVRDNLTSAICGGGVRYHRGCEVLSVQYQENEWVYPNLLKSKLFVFDNLEDAKDFARYHKYDWKIYECEILNPTKKAPFYSFITEQPSVIIDLWRNYKNKKKYTHLTSGMPPTGTIRCDAVKLTKRIT